MEKVIRSDNFGKRIYLYIFFIFNIVFAFYYTELRFQLNLQFEHATLELLMNGKAHLPFQYRMLIPKLAAFLYNFSPVKNKIPNIINLFFIIEFLAVFSVVFIFRYYLSLFLKNKKLNYILVFLIYPVLVFTYLIPRSDPIFYPYDTFSILFFTAALIFLYKKQFIPYYLIFITATFNRETTCFLTIIFLFTYCKKISNLKLSSHLFLQFILWLSVKLLLRKIYINNSGDGVFENHFFNNIKYLSDFEHYPSLFSALAYIWIPVLVKWREIPDDFLKKAILVIIFFIPGMILVGNIYEIRIYGELIPVFLTPFILLLINFVKKQKIKEMTF